MWMYVDKYEFMNSKPLYSKLVNFSEILSDNEFTLLVFKIVIFILLYFILLLNFILFIFQLFFKLF